MAWKFYINGEPNPKFRCCHDCKFITAFVSLWCSNEEAKRRGYDVFGTSMDCDLWQPMPKWSDVHWFLKILITITQPFCRTVVRKAVHDIKDGKIIYEEGETSNENNQT